MKNGSKSFKKCTKKLQLVRFRDNIIDLVKKTLVFDLDETLVRAQKHDPINGFDTKVNVYD
jgi:predicted HAD superfamily phosphohydrolase YqeG